MMNIADGGDSGDGGDLPPDWLRMAFDSRAMSVPMIYLRALLKE